jgi:hypothetical protein
MPMHVTVLPVLQLLMQHGAQLDEPMPGEAGLCCIQCALIKQDVRLLRALLSCLDKMTPTAKEQLQQEILLLYDARDSSTWLAVLAAKGLEVVPYMEEPVHMLPTADWPEVSGGSSAWKKDWHVLVHQKTACGLFTELLIASVATLVQLLRASRLVAVIASCQRLDGALLFVAYTDSSWLTCVLQEAKIQAVEALVALGWDINTTSRRYVNLLVGAAEQGLWRMVKWLLGELLVLYQEAPCDDRCSCLQRQRHVSSGGTWLCSCYNGCRLV